MDPTDPTPLIKEPPEFVTRFPFESAEFVRASRGALRNRVVQPWLRRLVWIFGLCCYVLFSLTWVDRWRATGVLVAVSAFALAWLLWVGVQRWLVPLLAVQSATAELPASDTSIVIGLTRHGVRSKSGDRAAEIPWYELQQAVETREFFLLYISPSSALYLPKRILSRGEREVVGALLREHLAIHGKLRTGRVWPTPGWQGWLSLGLAAVWTLLMLGLSLTVPDEVFAGDELPARYREALLEEGFLEPREEVLLFYSAASWSVREEGNLLTNRRVVSFERVGEDLYHEEVPYEEIYQLKLFESAQGEPSRIQVHTSSGHVVWLLVTPYMEGDHRFFERLESEWRRRVPEGQEQFELKGAPVDPDAAVG